MNGVKAIGEGANMPSTLEAIEQFISAACCSDRLKPPMQAGCRIRAGDEPEQHENVMDL